MRPWWYEEWLFSFFSSLVQLLLSLVSFIHVISDVLFNELNSGIISKEEIMKSGREEEENVQVRQLNVINDPNWAQLFSGQIRRNDSARV